MNASPPAPIAGTARLSRPVIAAVIAAGWMMGIGLASDEPASAKLRSDGRVAPTIDSLPLPAGFSADLGAIAFAPEGRLLIVSRHTGILRGTPGARPEEARWQTVCDQALYSPTGLLVETGGSLLIAQSGELTRLYDTDSDGLADFFEALGPVLPGPERLERILAGPLPDGDGNLLLALAVATPSATGDKALTCRVVKIAPDGSVQPWATGLPAIAGLAMHGNGQFFATVDACAWRAGAALVPLEAGSYHGDPSNPPPSPAEPDSRPVDGIVTRPAICLPREHFGDALSEPVFLSGGAEAAEALVAERHRSRLLRLNLEKVGDTWQGAAFVCLDDPRLGAGSHRFAWNAESHELYVGQSAPGRGLKRLQFAKPDAAPAGFSLVRLSLARDGFEFTFSQRVDRELASDPEQWQVRHRGGAASADESPATIRPRQVIITPDGKGVALQFDDLVAGAIYEFDLAQLKSQTGKALSHPFACYTLNRLHPAPPVDPNPPPVPHPRPDPATQPEAKPDATPDEPPGDEEADPVSDATGSPSA